MGEFFNPWPLWQKMCFVLGCGIAFTMMAGFLKVFYNHYRLRQYSKADKGKKVQTPEMLEAQPVTTASIETKDEVPFGIRAIQSGIEIDGVWISRTNTPVGSSRASIISEKPNRSYNNSNLELPQTAMHASSRNSSRAPSTFDRAVSAERITSNDSRSSSPGRGRASGPRCSNCNHCVSRNSPALHALESPRSAPISGPPSPLHPIPAESGRSSNKSSRRTSDESDYMAISHDVRAYETAYIRTPSVQTPIDPRTDLDLLQSHRLSHVAETGQLTPRVRKPGHSGEWASVAENQIQSVNGVSYFMPQKTPSPPLPAIVDPPQETVVEDIMPTAESHQETQSRQAVPLMESYAPKAAYYPDTYQPRGPQHQYSYDEVPYEVNTEQNQRDSQVLRKVNAGFEILRPGTFQPPTPEEVELAEKRQSKKLQKKRRTSGDSRQSAFVEQV